MKRPGKGGSSLAEETAPRRNRRNVFPVDSPLSLSLSLPVSLSLALAETFVIGDVECDLIRIFFSSRARAECTDTVYSLSAGLRWFLKGYGLQDLCPTRDIDGASVAGEELG